jgi:hypothetical protein
MMRVVVIVASLLIAGDSGWAQFDINKALQGLSGVTGSGLSDAKIGSGLQEALKIGTETPSALPARPMGSLKTSSSKS